MDYRIAWFERCLSLINACMVYKTEPSTKKEGYEKTHSKKECFKVVRMPVKAPVMSGFLGRNTNEIAKNTEIWNDHHSVEFVS